MSYLISSLGHPSGKPVEWVDTAYVTIYKYIINFDQSVFHLAFFKDHHCLRSSGNIFERKYILDLEVSYA